MKEANYRGSDSRLAINTSKHTVGGKHKDTVISLWLLAASTNVSVITIVLRIFLPKLLHPYLREADKLEFAHHKSVFAIVSVYFAIHTLLVIYETDFNMASLTISML